MLRQGSSPVNSPLGWFPLQDTHEIAATADKSRGHPPATACHIALPAHHIPAIPHTCATRHQPHVREITSAPSSLTSATTKGLPRQFPGGADLRGGGASGRLVETCPAGDSDGASTPVDPRWTAHVAPSEAPTAAGAASIRRRPSTSKSRLRSGRVSESRGPASWSWT